MLVTFSFILLISNVLNITDVKLSSSHLWGITELNPTLVSSRSHNVDVEVFLPEAHLRLLQYPLPWTHGDPDLLKSLFIHVRQLQDTDLLWLKIRPIFLKVRNKRWASLKGCSVLFEVKNINTKSCNYKIISNRPTLYPSLSRNICNSGSCPKNLKISKVWMTPLFIKATLVSTMKILGYLIVGHKYIVGITTLW